MEFKSGKPRRPFPNLSKKPNTSTWLTKPTTKNEKTSAKNNIDEYDIDRVDELDNEVEYLKETNRLPKATATIQEQRTLRVNERNGRRQTRETREEDLDRELRDLDMYEEGMTLEDKIGILKIVKESRDSAANMQPSGNRRKSGRRFSEQSVEDRPSSSHSEDEATVVRTVTPELFPETKTSPISNRRNSPETKRLTRTCKKSEIKFPFDDSDSDPDFPPLVTRIVAEPRIFQRTETTKLGIGKSEDNEIGNISDDSSNESSSQKSIPRKFYGSVQLSRPSLQRSGRPAAKTSLCLRQSPMVNQVANVWFNNSDANKEATLPISRKRKLAADRYEDKIPYYCPLNGDPSYHASVIKRSIEEHHKRLRAYQAQSLTLMPWGEPITKVFKYTNRNIPTSPLQDKFKKETDTPAVQAEEVTSGRSKSCSEPAQLNSIQEKCSTSLIANESPSDSEDFVASENLPLKNEALAKPSPCYGLRRKRKTIPFSSPTKIKALLDSESSNETAIAHNDRLFLRQHVQPSENNNRTNGASAMLVEPLDLGTSQTSRTARKEVAKNEETVFDKLLAKTASEDVYDDDEEPLPMDVVKGTKTYAKKSLSSRKRTRGSDVPSSPKFKQEVPLKKISESR